MPTGSPGSPHENGGLPAGRAAPYAHLERAGRGAWWVIGLIVLSGVALYLLRRYGSFLFPSLVGIVLATTLSPVVGWMERHRVPRLLGAVLVSIVIIALLVALAWAAVVIVVDQSAQIWQTLTEAGARIDRWLGGTGEAGDTVARVEKAIGGLPAISATSSPSLSRASASSTDWSWRCSLPAASPSSSSGRDRWCGAGSRAT